jgi:hypothetical protein
MFRNKKTLYSLFTNIVHFGRAWTYGSQAPWSSYLKKNQKQDLNVPKNRKENS